MIKLFEKCIILPEIFWNKP